MKRQINTLVIFFLGALMFSSCGKNNDEGKMIPHNAVFVAHVDLNSLGKKLSWEEIKQTGWFARAYNDSSIEDWHKKLMDDPGASGIDFDKGLVVFASQADGPSNYYIVLQGSVKDENKFLEFNKNIGPGQSAQKNGNINMITLKGNSVVGWNGDHFAYVMNSGAPDINPDNWLPVGYTQDQQPVNTTGVTNFCARLFSLDADSSLAKNEKFSDLVKTKGDVHYWQNNEEIWKHIPDMGMLSMLKLDVFFQGNYNATTISFNDGKIESDMLMYSGKELTDFLKKYKGSKINTDMVRKIPSGNIVGLMAMNFKPEGIQELIKLTGTDGFVNMFLQQAGFSLDDVSKANDGDLLIAVTDLNIKSETVATTDSVGQMADMQKNIQPDMNFILSMSVKDKASFQKITDAGNKLGGEMKDSGVAMLLNDDYFVVSNHKAFADQFIAGKNNEIDFISKINNTPIGFYLDLQEIFKANGTQNITDTTYRSMMDKTSKMWKNVSMTGGDMKGDALSFHFEANLVDEKTNSLKQLNTYFNDMHRMSEVKRKQDPVLKNLDSLLTPPPIDTVAVQ